MAPQPGYADIGSRARGPTRFSTFLCIGIAAGFFSALFGIGGGFVVVPLLMLLCSFPPRAAAATSLAVVGITGAFGSAVFAASGDVDWSSAAAIGCPAVAGVLSGTWLQQRVSSALLVALLSLLLVLASLMLLLK